MRKHLLREVYDAFLVDSIKKLEWFCTLPPPLGVWQVNVSTLIDIDEMGFYLKGLASKSGRAYTSCWVRHPSHYRSRCWRKYPKTQTVDTYIAGQLRPFFGGILSKASHWTWRITRYQVMSMMGDAFCGLTLHKMVYVMHAIEGCSIFNQFISFDRPPYRPKIAPIEYVFCEVAAELSRRVKRGWNTQVVHNKLFDICNSIGTGGRFYSTFLHYGYPL